MNCEGWVAGFYEYIYNNVTIWCHVFSVVELTLLITPVLHCHTALDSGKCHFSQIHWFSSSCTDDNRVTLIQTSLATTDLFLFASKNSRISTDHVALVLKDTNVYHIYAFANFPFCKTIKRNTSWIVSLIEFYTICDWSSPYKWEWTHKAIFWRFIKAHHFRLSPYSNIWQNSKSPFILNKLSQCAISTSR